MRLTCLALVVGVLTGLPASYPRALAAQEERAPARSLAKPWVGRYAEFEEFLRNARVVRDEIIPVGVTEPRRGFFEPGGLVESAIFKALMPSRRTGFFESYQSEIAAYELDKLLGLDMVPATVERTFNGQRASAQMWVKNAEKLADLQAAGERSPDVLGWLRQTRRMRVFINLVANIDPNEGNNLVVRDPVWHLVLVDHSRAFTNRTDLLMEMSYIDRPFLERLRALDEAMLAETVAPLVLDGSRSLLRRRDAIVEHFEKLVRDNGEANVLTQ